LEYDLNKNKIRKMGSPQTKKILYIQGNNQQSEETIYRIGPGLGGRALA
jgi:hypothetical protein